ncbi:MULTISPECIES: aldo/keto reductase [Burkholderiaceae]|uniref:aldo/keto reductase n=1 Tax=Burkholderiaceae TaxID=119060 RepID=UPI0014216671|nr:MULTISPECIES: aldo/keto reductase [Burkholderiaceae]MBN3845643.1 aldo/keto reductase [Paraburkholderia sp. Ac-20342]NIF51081.1 aldo/keto reductase [Burkholderia sp. Ax-1724]
MEYARLGRSSLRISRLGFGAMGIGNPGWRKWVLEEDAARPILRAAVEAGINFVDTCDFYSAGASETVLGNALWDYASRDEIVLATKLGNPMGTHPNARGYSRKHIFSAVDASLKRLKTDYVDLLQTHIWQPDTDLEELVVAFDDLVKSGKVRYVGATTMPAWAFVQCVNLAKQMGRTPFVSMQCEYNVCHREAERELIPFCRAYDIALVPFSPLARGFLCADRRDARNATARHDSDDYTLKHYHRPGDFAALECVAKIAAKRGVEPSQVALAWALAQPGIISPIFGATQVVHVASAVAALDLKLDEEELRALAGTYETRPLGAKSH